MINEAKNEAEIKSRSSRYDINGPYNSSQNIECVSI